MPNTLYIVSIQYVRHSTQIHNTHTHIHTQVHIHSFVPYLRLFSLSIMEIQLELNRNWIMGSDEKLSIQTVNDKEGTRLQEQQELGHQSPSKLLCFTFCWILSPVALLIFQQIGKCSYILHFMPSTTRQKLIWQFHLLPASPKALGHGLTDLAEMRWQSLDQGAVPRGPTKLLQNVRPHWNYEDAGTFLQKGQFNKEDSKPI